VTYVVISNGVVIHCVSVNDEHELEECYPGCTILPRTGEENIGWLYDGVTFTRG
jgi:hypothetical protein